jgi:hypothetical protein
LSEAKGQRSQRKKKKQMKKIVLLALIVLTISSVFYANLHEAKGPAANYQHPTIKNTNK